MQDNEDVTHLGSHCGTPYLSCIGVTVTIPVSKLLLRREIEDNDDLDRGIERAIAARRALNRGDDCGLDSSASLRVTGIAR
jgi:hypothetical protein